MKSESMPIMPRQKDAMEPLAEAALSESEEKYRLLIRSIPAVVFRGYEDWSIDFFDDKIEEMTGYAKMAFDNRELKWKQLIVPEDFEKTKRVFRTSARGHKSYEREYRIRNRSGQILWIQERSQIVLNADGKLDCINGVFLDITQRKQTEESLRLNEARLEALLQLNRMTGASMKEITDFALEEGVRLTKSKIGYLALMNEDETVLSMHAWSKYSMEQCAIVDKPIDYPLKTTGLWGEAVRQRRPVITNDYASSPLRRGYPSGHVPVLRHMNIPVFDGERIVAVAGVGNKEEAYDESDVRQLRLLMHGMWRLVQRKRSEEALRESEQKYRLLINNIPGLVYKGYLDGHIEFFDDKVEEITGYKREIFSSREMKWTDLIRPEDLPGAKKAFLQALKTRRSYSREYRIRHAQGQTIWIQAWGQVIFDAGGRLEYVYGVLYDITPRKQTEETLRESEARYRILFNSGNDAIFVHRAIVEGVTSKFIEVNDVACRRLGYTREELLQLSPTQVSTPESLGIFPGLRKKLLRDKHVLFETIHRTKNGKKIPVEINALLFDLQGQPTVLSIARDITERRRAERALRESEEKYRHLVESANDAIFVADAETGVILEVNRRGEELLGLPSFRIIGRHHTELHPPEEAEHHRQLFKKAATAGQMQFDNLQVRHRDGHLIPVDIGMSVTEWGGRKIVQGIFRDITSRKKMEEELLKASKLESLAFLAAGIAHDFNNLLTAILGNVSLASAYHQGDEEVSERLTDAQKACLRAKDLTKQLLTFAQGGAPVKKTTDILELLRDSAHFALRGSNVRCEIQTAESLWPAEVDEGQINQVINNLMINADQAMPEGGVIRISAENFLAGPDSGLPLAPGRYLKVSVADQGLGIPPEHLSKIFDPFFTTKQKGSGLGLATSYSIIKNHGGYIAVSSQLGLGTVFDLYLPASRGKAQTPIKKKDLLIHGHGRVLVMDDEEIIRQVTGKMLQKMGYQAELARDGAEAVDRFIEARSNGRPFDLVILDLTVPAGMGGKEALEKIRSLDPQVKAIVSSGYSHDPIMADFQRYGFKGIIAKPYKIDELSTLLSRILGEKG